MGASVPVTRWTAELVAERWESFSPAEQEALLRFGPRQAPWESVPDTALRILKCDHRVSLGGAKIIDAVFRTAYNELVEPLPRLGSAD